MDLNKKDISILRELAKKKAQAASLDVNGENVKLWTAVNDLNMIKPAIFINELPWHEMNVDNELTCQCENESCRKIETILRRELYSFRHMPGNMVITNTINCPVCVIDTGFGISENVDVTKTDSNNSIVSRHFNIQISSEEDISKIKDPVVSIDTNETEKRLSEYHEIFDGILDVKKVGQKGKWFTPWDNLIRYTGVQEAMMDLILNPDYIDKLVERFVDASLIQLEQYNKLGLWSSNNDNTRVGSGGYGYTSDLAPADQHMIAAPTSQLWGCGNAQIFSEVSPQMHWDFSLKHELRWLSNFGLNYYGCCEQLHHKMDLMDKIPNLRKISMSPWSKIEVANERAKGKYVLSCKPNPAIFAEDPWRPEQAKADILDILEKSKGCSIELIMKDVSTVNYKPQRIWEWATIAQETIDEFYS